MTRSSSQSAEGKRKTDDDLEKKTALKKRKENPEEKETMEGFTESIQQMEGRVDLSETKSDQISVEETTEGFTESIQQIEGRVELSETKSDQISVEETVEGLDEPPEFAEEVAVRGKTLSVGNLAPETKISDIIDVFNYVGKVVVSVRLIVDHKGDHVGYGFVEFASANEAKKALEKENGQYLHNHKIILELAKNPQRHEYCLDHKVCYEGYLRRQSRRIREDEPVGFVEAVLFVDNLSPQTKIWHINDFFDNVGEVVSLRLIVNHEGKHVGCGFVEFASAYQAKKALEKKNGEYLHDHKIFLDVAKPAPRPRNNLAEKLCYEDYLRRKSLLREGDNTVEGLDEHADFVEAVAIRKKTLFVGHLSSQTEISDIINFFKNTVEVVSVRLIVDHKGKHVGYGLVEFTSANDAKKALEKKNGECLHDRKIFLELAKIAPYPPPKYCLDHKIWYEDYIRGESLVMEEDDRVEGLVEEVATREKTLFVASLPRRTRISNIIKFFKEVGKVVSVRLIVTHSGTQLGCGFVEFASADEAKKALEKKNGGYFQNRKVYLGVAEIAPYPLRPKHTLEEKLWYLGQESHAELDESLVTEEDDLESEEMVPKVGVFSGKKITFSDDEDEESPTRRLPVFSVFSGKKITFSDVDC